MSKKSILPTKYQLISLIEMGDFKLDFDTFEKTILGNFYTGTPVFENFGFSHVEYKFPEKKDDDKYSLTANICLYQKKYSFLIGQSGLFLKIDETSSYTEVSNIIGESKQFIDFCKLFLTKPFGVVHRSNGDYYITNQGAYRHFISYRNLDRDTTEIFDDKKEEI